MNPGPLDDARFRDHRSNGLGQEFDPSVFADPLNFGVDSEFQTSKATGPMIPSGTVVEEGSVEQTSSGISRYEAELAKKDELINALVRELEQAVEQVDRFHRTGAEFQASNAAKPVNPSGTCIDQAVVKPAASVIAQYEADLAKKDELVNALVRELEQAAEQLDRYRRTGAERSHDGPSTTVFSPIRQNVESQISGLDELRQMAEEWHENQPVSILARIESQLESFHDLLKNLRRDGPSRGEAFDAGEARPRNQPQPDSTIDLERNDVTIEESASSWESIKRQILGEIPSAPPPDEPVARSAHVPTVDEMEIVKTVSETPSPTNIDFGTADVEALRNAINERDDYIIQLNRLFRAKSAFTVPADWAELANVPAEMQVRVQSLIDRLDVQIRLGEVEMSLERARVARERSQVAQEREQIEKHLRRLGLNSISELGSISAAPGTSTDRRWMRFLGPSAK